MSDHTTASATDLQQLMMGYRWTQIVYVAAKLGIADLLASGPQSVEALATTTGTHAEALYRVLRALASMGIFAETSDHTFALTPIAEMLRTNRTDPLRSSVIFQGEEVYRAWGELMYSVRTGTPAFEHVFGAPHFTYLATHLDANATFNQTMSEGSWRSSTAIAGAYDFPATGTVVDVGGGQGVLLAAVLHAQPALRGILFDRSHVVADAERTFTEAGVAKRCTCVAGDFFASVPSGGDLYLLRRILHDWDDEHSIAILRNCAQAMGPSAKVLVVESIIEPGNPAPRTTLLDLQMLIMTGGQERTAEQYRRLFAAAELSLTRILPTGAEAAIIEGERAPRA